MFILPLIIIIFCKHGAKQKFYCYIKFKGKWEISFTSHRLTSFILIKFHKVMLLFLQSPQRYLPEWAKSNYAAVRFRSTIRTKSPSTSSPSPPCSSTCSLHSAFSADRPPTWEALSSFYFIIFLRMIFRTFTL